MEDVAQELLGYVGYEVIQVNEKPEPRNPLRLCFGKRSKWVGIGFMRNLLVLIRVRV